MRIWIDLANSPHVPLLDPLVQSLGQAGHDVLITARDHAQTVALAARRFRSFRVIGGPSPGERFAKGRQIVARAEALRRFASSRRPQVAFSHGSYAQILAARAAGIPAVTMMDYEHQPANHLSFRVARHVIVPDVFPAEALHRCGARSANVIRYAGFKEELYLTGFQPDPSVLAEVGVVESDRVLVVFRPPPDGALYHRMGNERFEQVLAAADREPAIDLVLLPRSAAQAERLRPLAPGACVPGGGIDGSSLLALADVAVGGGGTMNRESAILGTPTYTLFAGPPAAVDEELIRQDRLRDLRIMDGLPRWEKKASASDAAACHGPEILDAVVATILSVTRTPLSLHR